MNESAARTLINDAFEHAYDEQQVRRFVQNLLVEVDMKTGGHRSGQMVYESFREHVASYKRLAKYTDPNGEELDVLAVKLKTAHKLERARTMQRNFAATYLKDPARQGREAALVAYYADGTDEWRLSFVQMEYRTVVDEESGDVKAEEELTPVRYTFLVGANEPTHTPKRQFVPLLQSDELRFPPTLGDLKDAFDIEVVTDAFFEEYRSHYKTLTEQVKSALEADDAARAEFEDKGVSAVAFAEKLLGQLVFLYFLQKKGWLGVQRGDDWGEGPGDFLRQLYEGAYADYNNFYQDLLEPLFYDALATDRGSGNYFGRLNCRIPFLNGGLFQPIHGVNRARVRLPLPNGTFGDIFDTFDRYNFTVREDEPLDKEVAVDPEMLGKVFEKMLDADQRKEKGAFYTPRDIVHYMCQQSLIDHLDTELNVRETPLRQPEGQQGDAFDSGTAPQGVLAGEDYNPKVKRAHLEALVRGGTNWIEHDTRVQESEATNGKYADHEAPRPIRRHAEAIDRVLASMKICDPAVGSGAFPVGMMQEIVQARRVLDTYLDDDTDRSAYALKRHAIQNTIHGVDIEPRAIDIARLRLWLSLVVDEEDFAQIRPLPNLRYKIVQGDALQQMERHVFNNEKEDQLHRLMAKYVNTAHPSEKERLQAKIDDLLDDLLGEGEFDFRLYFGTVFEEQGGFDVVIGNPPYVRQESHSTLSKEEKKQFETYYGTADLYVYFIERGMQLLREAGLFCYIVSNKWMRARYGKPLRQWLKRQNLVELIDFKDLPVFQGTIAYPCILRMRREESDTEFRAVEVDDLGYEDLSVYVKQNGFDIEYRFLHEKGWSLVDEGSQSLIDTLEDSGESLGNYLDGKIHFGIKTGLNDAFIISPEKRDELVERDPRSEERIREFPKGKDLKGPYAPIPERRYLVFFPNGWTDAHAPDDRDEWAWLQEQYPAITDHLAPFEKRARERWDQGEYWWELRACSYYDEFEEPKILYPSVADRGSFTLDRKGVFADKTCYFIPSDDKYLLGVLNSSLLFFYFSNIAVERQNGFYEYLTQYVERFPIYEIDENDPNDVAARDAIADHVDTMLDLHERRAEATTEVERDRLQERIEEVDAEIDRRVYALYGLGTEEIGIVGERGR
jgi:type I restriction-modification system DNA methylase subunit